MARTKDELPRWAKILIAIVFIGIIVWAMVPGEVLYISLGIALAVIGGVSYLIYRKWGIEPFKSLAKKSYEWLQGDGRTGSKKEMLTSLPSHDANRLKLAVGYKCEKCSSTRNLDVHHIIPRNEEGSSHRLSNLLVLCTNCHRDASRGEPNRGIQKLMARQPNRFPQSKYHLVRNWRYGR